MTVGDDRVLSHEKSPGTANDRSHAAQNDRLRDPEFNEFLNRVNHDLLGSKPPDDAVAAAFEAMQRLSFETDAEQSAETFVPDRNENLCHACGSKNRPENRFCSTCGVALASSPASDAILPDRRAKEAPAMPEGSHHYHHHYHHHYFSTPDGAFAGADPRSTAQPVPPRNEPVRLRAPLTGPALSRAELAVRRIAQDWALACNTRQLEDLVDLYIPDALLMRPNLPAVRGTAAIREFLVTALDSGFGEVELEPLRVELFGDVAYEAGRCKMLVPMVLGKRREERGKYQMIYVRQSGGDWKIVSDCWSTDLGLALSTEGEAATSVPSNPSIPSRPPKK